MVIAEKMKPIVEGELVMECLMAILDSVCPEENPYCCPLIILKGQLQDESIIGQQM